MGVSSYGAVLDSGGRIGYPSSLGQNRKYEIGSRKRYTQNAWKPSDFRIRTYQPV